MTPQQLLPILRHARGRVANAWMQGSLGAVHIPDAPVCAVGGICAGVEGTMAMKIRDFGETDAVAQFMVWDVHQWAMQRFGIGFPIESVNIPACNDHPHTTQADVVEWFDSAIARCERLIAAELDFEPAEELVSV